ncbi:hypothetical protein F5880DRAFT_1501534 [Lentinula raphanica]|nr:hypothetical protein F5880DRAFT_1501534 [Lentinula raphanica]
MFVTTRTITKREFSDSDAPEFDESVQRSQNPSLAAPIPTGHSSSSPFIPRKINFTADCGLAHYYQVHPCVSQYNLPLPFTLSPESSRRSSPSPSPPPSVTHNEHIPRPPNAFMLFRSDFLKRDVIPSFVEKRQQTLSRVAGEVWNLMPADEKKCWYDKAADALRSHTEKYPNYKYSPVRKDNGGRKIKTKAIREEDAKNKDQIREIRETYLHMRGPAVAPARRRRRKEQFSTLQDKKPEIWSGSSSLVRLTCEAPESNIRTEQFIPALGLGRPTYPYLSANDSAVAERAGYSQRLITAPQNMLALDSRSKRHDPSRLSSASTNHSLGRNSNNIPSLQRTTLPFTISATGIQDVDCPSYRQDSSSHMSYDPNRTWKGYVDCNIKSETRL